MKNSSGHESAKCQIDIEKPRVAKDYSVEETVEDKKKDKKTTASSAPRKPREPREPR